MDAHLTAAAGRVPGGADGRCRLAGPLPEPGDPGRLRARAAADLRARLRARPGAAAAPVARSQANTSEAAWEVLAGERATAAARPPRPARRRPRRLPGRRSGRSTGLLRADFEPDVTGRRRSSAAALDAATEMARAARRRRRPRDHRPHPPRRPAAERSRVAAARRRPPPQHRQLGLRLGLPPPRRTRPTPTGRERSPGSRTTARRAASQLLLDRSHEEMIDLVAARPASADG